MAWMTAVFCDDVREEVGGKQSYIGVYGDKVSLPSLPAKLHKLHIIASVYFKPYWYMPSSVELILDQGYSMLLHKYIGHEELEKIDNLAEDGDVRCLKINITVEDLGISEYTSLGLEAIVSWYHDGSIEDETINIVSNRLSFD